MRKDRDWVLNKVKKCLALAAKASGNEAETALRQAKALMEQYDLSETDLELSDIKETVLATGKTRKNPPQWQSHLAGVCAKAFNCRILFFNGLDFKKGMISHVKKVKFIGIDINAELASYAFTVLQRQLKKDRRNYLNSLSSLCSLTTRRRRADLFADSWVKAIYSLVNKFAQNHEQLNLIDAYMAEYYETIDIEYSEKTKDKRYTCAKEAGYKSGKNAQLHPAVAAKNTATLPQLGLRLEDGQ